MKILGKEVALCLREAKGTLTWHAEERASE